jgi:nitrogenase subunit NifH
MAFVKAYHSSNGFTSFIRVSFSNQVKAMLIKKKAVVERVEKARQIRAQKKLAKAVQAQSKVAKQEAKREMLNEVKKFRRGERKDLSFLDDKPQQRKSNKNQ